MTAHGITSANLRRPLAAALTAAFLCACSDDQNPSKSSQPAQVPETAETPLKQLKRPVEWLEVHAQTSPADWLLARASRSGTNADDALRASTQKELETAAIRSGDTPRMVANRAVQLEAMLRAAGYDEPALTLIGDLADTVGEAGQAGGFGAICQYYFTLRTSGSTRDQALDELRKRYGSRP